MFYLYNSPKGPLWSLRVGPPILFTTEEVKEDNLKLFILLLNFSIKSLNVEFFFNIGRKHSFARRRKLSV